MKIRHIQYMQKKYGGSETYVDLLQKNSEHKHYVTYAKDSVLFPNDDPVFLKTYYDFKFSSKKIHGLDLVHSHFLLPGYFAQQQGGHTVCSSHCMFSKEFEIAANDTQDDAEIKELHQAQSFFSYFESKHYPKIENLVVYSKFHKKELEDLGAKPELLKLPVDVDHFNIDISPQEARQRLGLPDSFTIFFLGRPTVLKGFSVLAEAYNNLSKKKAMQLMVMGDFKKQGQGISYVPAVRANSGQDTTEVELGGNVFAFDPVVPTQLPLYYKAADVLVCPSLYEAVGYVNLEAMASGVPVIASDVAGLPDVINDRQTGLLFEVGDSSALEHAISEIKENSILKKQVIKNALDFVQDFRVDKVIKEHDAYYQKVVDNG